MTTQMTEEEVDRMIERVRFIRQKWWENRDENERLSKEQWDLENQLKRERPGKLCEVAGHTFGPGGKLGLKCTQCGFEKFGNYG